MSQLDSDQVDPDQVDADQIYVLQCERNNSVNTKGSRFGLRTFVMPRGEAEGQYSYPKANTTGRGAVTGQI